MGQPKTEALERIRKLSDNVKTEAITEELYLKEVDRALQDVAEGRVLTLQELKERLLQWRRSSGRVATRVR